MPFKGTTKYHSQAICFAFQTANGIIYADEQADVVVHMLYETTMTFYVLDDTVNVASLTILVDDYRFDYCQNHGAAPDLEFIARHCKMSLLLQLLCNSKRYK